MLKKQLLICAMITGLFSTASYAGGGSPSWQPSVQPINCVMGSSTKFFWNNSKDCNEVISRGYAKGVQYTGTFVYNDGSTQGFNALINSSNDYTPVHPQGKKVTRLSNTQWSWLR